MKKLTIKMLQDCSNVGEAIELAMTFNLEYPTKPIKPILPKIHNSTDVNRYQSDLKAYEVLEEKYKEERTAYQVNSAEIDAIIKEYLLIETGVSKLPELQRDKVWRKAWEDGHSAGHYEVYLELSSLAELFE